jgi:hypothetical protein
MAEASSGMGIALGGGHEVLMSRDRRSIALLAKSAAIAFAVTLLLGRSPDLQATGDATVASARTQAESTGAPDSADLQLGEARVDALEISTELVPSAGNPSRVAVRVVAKNPTDREITARCLVTLQRYRGEAMARVSPPPTTVRQHTEELEVVPQATISRDLPLPAAVSAELLRARKAAETAEAKGVMQTRFVSYEVAATPIAKPAAVGSRAKARVTAVAGS